MKKVFIRVDAHKEIGVGHLVRSLALGHMLKDHFDVHFLCQKRDEKTLYLIHDQNFPLILIKAQEHAKEIEELKTIVTPNDFMVLDGYDFDLNYQMRLKSMVDKLVYIDDLNQFEVVADLLINHNFHAEAENYQSTHALLLQGPKYLLLRPEFFVAQMSVRQHNKIKSVLVCMGGADRENLTFKCAEGLKKIFSGKVSLVIGPAYAYEEELREFAKNKGIVVHKSLSAIPLITEIQNHDLLICTSSMIAAEAASLGTPIILGYMEKNQEKITHYFEKNNLAASLGNLMTITDWSLKLKVVMEKTNFQALVENQLKILDLSSKERIIQSFKYLQLKSVQIETERFMLRNLSINDVTDQYVSWFEDEQTKRFIVTASKSNSRDKLQAYVQDKSSSQSVLFLGIFDKKLQKHIGNIKFEPVDWINSYTIMGILIGEKDYRGQGVSGEVLIACGKFFKGLGLKWLALGVENDNQAAVRSYEKIGFKKDQGRFIHFKPIDQSIEMILELKNV